MKSYLAEIRELRKNLVESYKEGDYKRALFLGEHLLELYKKSGDEAQSDLGEDFHNVAVIFDELGYYEKAAEYYGRGAELKKVNRGESRGYADTMNNLAIVYSSLDRHEEALKTHMQVLKVRGRRLGQSHKDYIHTLYNIGNCYESLKQYEKAIESHGQALERSLNCRSLQIIDLADIHSSMGRCYDKMGNYKKAIYNYEVALDIVEKKLGSQNIAYLNNAIALTFVCEKAELIGLAVEYCERAVEVHRQMFQQGHLDYLNYLSYLASLYYKDSQFEKSFQLHTSGMEIIEKKFGQNHLLYFDFLDKISLDYCGMKDFTKALEIGRKTFALREAYESQNTRVKSYVQMGKIMAKKEDCMQALTFYKQALDILEKDSDENQSLHAQLWFEFACIFEQHGSYEAAAFLYEKALEINKILSYENKKIVISLMNAIVQVRQKQEEYTKAVLICLEMEEIARNALGKRHSEYGEVLRNLGIAYQKSGDLASAGKYLEEALRLQRETLDGDNPIYIETLEAFAEICLSRGDFSYALQLYKERNDMNFEETPEEQRVAACTLLAMGNCCFKLGDKENARKYAIKAEERLIQSGLMPNERYLQLKEIYGEGKNAWIPTNKPVRRRMRDSERKSLEDAIAFMRQLYEISKAKGNFENREMAFAVFSLGEMHQRLGQKNEAIFWYTLAEKYANPSYYARTCIRLGEVLLLYGDEEKALQKFVNAKEYIAEYGDTHSWENCRVLGHIGDYFYKKGEMTTALGFYHSWNQLYKELNLPECASRDNRIIKIGKILTAFERHKEAMELYYVLAVSIRNREGETERFSKMLLRVASLHIQIGNIQEGETMLDHVLILAGKNGITTESFGKVCDKVGRLYAMGGLEEKALEALKLSYGESLNGKKCMTKEGIQLLRELLWKSGDSKAYFSVKNGHELE
ncbi:Photosystem I assembly protein Ycf3 [anaerobic digester metagenome]